MDAHDLRRRFAAVLARYPGEDFRTLALIANDAAFRAVCEDYVLARSVLADCERRRAAGAPAPVEDYRTLVAALADELDQGVAAAKSGQ